MPKSSKEKIADDEQRIIKELKTHAKDSISSIAEKCGCSRQAVWRTIKRLEENNTIWGYSAIVDDDKLNQKRYFIFLKRSHNPVSKEIIEAISTKRLMQETKDIDVTLEGSYFVHGFTDWMLCITANDITKVKKFCEVLNRLFEEGIIIDMKILEVLFSIEKNCINNPDMEKIVQFFI